MTPEEKMIEFRLECLFSSVEVMCDCGDVLMLDSVCLA